MCHYSQIASNLDPGLTNTGDLIGSSLNGQTGEALVVGVLIAAVAWLVGRDHRARLPAALARRLAAMTGWSL
jgi:hypothetical protein